VPTEEWMMDNSLRSNNGYIKKNMLGIKGLNKKEKLKQSASCYAKFLNNIFARDGVESRFDVHL